MKNTITTIALTVVLTFGATVANAGILISDSPAPANTCHNGILISDNPGILISDAPGILISDIADALFGGFDTDENTTCKDNNGILISDAPNAGILISD